MQTARLARGAVAALAAAALLVTASPTIAKSTPIAGPLEELTWEDPADRTLPGAAPPGWRQQVCCSRSAQVVNTPVRAGGHALRFQLDRTDPDVAGSKRAELVESAIEPATAERWYGMSVFLPSTVWSARDRSAEIVAQWHHAADTGSPPLSLGIRNGSWEVVQHWENYSRIHTLGAHTLGQWTDWVFHVKWSPNSSGVVEVWRNGLKVLTLPGKNKYNDGQGVYFKFGIYKWDWKSNPANSTTDRRILFHDELRIADHTGNYDTVAPR